MPTDLGGKSNDLQKQSEFISKLKEWGFSVNSYNVLVKGLEEIEKHHKKNKSIRSTLDYDIDGIVYKIDDLNLQKKDLATPQIRLGGQLHTNFLRKKLHQELKT